MTNPSSEWRWADPTGQQRLVREDELRSALASGVIPANAPVWRPGWKHWKPASDVAELNGESSGDVPPPPMFVSVAQKRYEGQPITTEEPPPPPRYVPARGKAPSFGAARAPTSVPTLVDAVPPPAAPHAAPQPPQPLAGPLPKQSGKPPAIPLPKKPKSVAPPLPPAAKKSAPPPVPARVEPTPESSGRHTLPVAPAPPPLHKAAPAHAAPVEHEAPPPSKYPTLMFGEDSPAAAPAPKPEETAPPIVVPPPEPSNVTHAVTRPPPWGEGSVGIADQIPRAAPPPMFPPEREERSSDPPRPMELSSSDLTSDMHPEVVKPAPLVAAERPRALGARDDFVPARREIASPSRTSGPPPDLAADTVPHVRPPAARMEELRDLSRRSLSVARKGVEQASSIAKRARDRTKEKAPWLLPAVGGGVFVLVVMLAILAFRGTPGGSKSSAASSGGGASSAPPSTSPTAAQPTTAAATVATAAKHARPVACALSGAPRTVAPKALVPSGVEVTPAGSQIALGFATSHKEGVLEMLDPTSVASASSLHLRAEEPIRRVLFYSGGDGKPQAALDADKKGDRLEGRRTLRASPPLDVGAMDGTFAWAPHGSNRGTKLWALAGDEPVQALRGEPLPGGKGFAVAFRQKGGIFVGTFGGNPPAPIGPLLRVEGLGPQVGSPAVAASGDRVMVAWADRGGAPDPWGLRYAILKVGDATIQPQSFTLPPGGLGEQAMSPGIASLPDGQFLMLWTEGQVSDHQVRGAVFDGSSMRDVFTASADGVNAGQPQGAILPDGHGVVAFLASSGKGFAVVATPIQCTEK